MEMMLIPKQDLVNGYNAIRGKGVAGSIKSGELASKINQISSGMKPEQEKSVSYNSNGTYNVMPDTGKALSKVSINVSVQSEQKQTKTVNYTSNGSYSVTPDQGKVLDKVNISINVPTSAPPKLEEKTVTIKTNTTTTIEPSSGQDGLKKVIVKTEVPTSSTPSTGKVIPYEVTISSNTLIVPNNCSVGQWGFELWGTLINETTSSSPIGGGGRKTYSIISFKGNSYSAITGSVMSSSVQDHPFRAIVSTVGQDKTITLKSTSGDNTDVSLPAFVSSAQNKLILLFYPDRSHGQ